MSAACASPPFVQYPLDTAYIMHAQDWPSPTSSTTSSSKQPTESTYWRMRNPSHVIRVLWLTTDGIGTNDWNTLGKYPFATKIHLEQGCPSTPMTVVPAPISTSTYGLYAAQAHQAVVESSAASSSSEYHHHSRSHSHDVGSYFDLSRTRSLSPPYLPDIETAATSPQSAIYDPLHAHASPYMTSPAMMHHPLVQYQLPLETLLQPFDAPLQPTTAVEPLLVQEQPFEQPTTAPFTREHSSSGEEGLELVKLPSGQWQCPHCFKQFRRRDRGQAHVNVHINTRPYRCEGSCGNPGWYVSYDSSLCPGGGDHQGFGLLDHRPVYTVGVAFSSAVNTSSIWCLLP